MSALKANLKILYQRRVLWLGYLILIFPMINIDEAFYFHNWGALDAYLIIMLAIGVVAAYLHMEILLKPFSFCLPYKSKVIRNFHFIVGGAANLTGGIIFLFHPNFYGQNFLITIFMVGVMGLAAYFAGSILVLLYFLSRFRHLVFFLAWGAFLYMCFSLGLIERTYLSHPYFIPGLSIVICGVSWWIWGQRSWGRHSDQYEIAKGYLTFNLHKIQKSIGLPKAKFWSYSAPSIKDKTEIFYLGQMKRTAFLSRARYIWGMLYVQLGPYFGPWKLAISIFILLIGLAFYGYLPIERPFNTSMGIMIILGISWLWFRLPLLSSMLLPSGRREKFWGALVISLCGSIWATFIYIIVAGLLMIWFHYVPEVTWGDEVYSGTCISIFSAKAMALFLPILYVIQIMFRSNFILEFFLLMPAVVLAGFSPVWLGGLFSAIYLLLFWFSWTLFIVVLRYHFSRRCLVWKGRRTKWVF